MSVWYAIPSKRPLEEAEAVIKLWRERGYRTAIWRDEDWSDEDLKVDLPVYNTVYPGYAKVVNTLVSAILDDDSKAEWIVTGGDDVHPDPNKIAQDIAWECTQHFFEKIYRANLQQKPNWLTRWFGVMQPTGDPWEDSAGRIIERIAGSPWMGRDFCKNAYGGNGPLWPEYTHCFVDEELQCVAQKLGVFWQRPDINQHHQSWMRDASRMPDFLHEANSPEHWRKYSTLFKERKATGFPGHEPICI